jgi:hypothetical protein
MILLVNCVNAAEDQLKIARKASICCVGSPNQDLGDPLNK